MKYGKVLYWLIVSKWWRAGTEGCTSTADFILANCQSMIMEGWRWKKRIF